MDRLNDAVLSAIDVQVLDGRVVERAIRMAVELFKPTIGSGAERSELERRLTAVQQELDRLTATIRAGGLLDTLTAGIRERKGIAADLLASWHDWWGCYVPRCLRRGRSCGSCCRRRSRWGRVLMGMVRVW
jgi:hypothetical protein